MRFLECGTTRSTATGRYGASRLAEACRTARDSRCRTPDDIEPGFHSTNRVTHGCKGIPVNAVKTKTKGDDAYIALPKTAQPAEGAP